LRGGGGAPNLPAMASPPLKLKAQLLCGDAVAMGPGKADLLEAIAREGSISAAGRAMGMSYRRTWLLVDEMNRCWREPLVATTRGGGGGASVTEAGRAMLADYRAIEAAIGVAAEGASDGAAFSRLSAALLPMPREAKEA
jgi:molybdate transport system regulatory protein